jgi:hypothetical protein
MTFLSNRHINNNRIEHLDSTSKNIPTIHKKRRMIMDETLLDRIASSIAHFGEDPLYDYGLLGGIIGAVAGIAIAVATGKADCDVTLDSNEYYTRR